MSAIFKSEEHDNTEAENVKNMTKEIDIFVGKRVRERRTELKLSQEFLADCLGLTFQQVQKYEKGTNRIGAGRLRVISQVLAVPIDYFYQGLDINFEQNVTGFSEDTQQSGYSAQELLKPEVIKVINFLSRIKDPKMRGHIMTLLEVMATNAEDEGGNALENSDNITSLAAKKNKK